MKSGNDFMIAEGSQVSLDCKIVMEGPPKIAGSDTESCTLRAKTHGSVSLTVIMGSLSPLAAFLGHRTTFRPQAPGMNVASGYAPTATGDQHPERPSP
jgi:hypothetical protein